MQPIDIYNEFEIIQNGLIGTHAIHEFVKTYIEYSNGVGPKIYWGFTILPIVFNAESTKLIYSKNFSPGSFIKILSEKSDVFVTLQSRMQENSDKTFACIHLGCNSGLFGYDAVESRLYLRRAKSIFSSMSNISKEYQQILQTSRRLGAWYAKMTEEEILFYLDIKF